MLRLGSLSTSGLRGALEAPSHASQRLAARFLPLLCLVAWSGAPSMAAASQAVESDPCLRPAPGSVVPEPRDLRSRHGVLKVDLSVRNYRESDGSIRYCYLLADGTESPTLRVNPGD